MQALSQLSYGPRSAVSLAANAEILSDAATLSGVFPRRRRMRGLRRRVARFVAALFGGSASSGGWDDEAEGGVGVREPRRPLTPTLTGAAALDLPADGEDAT
jgi:hypothetical protein